MAEKLTPAFIHILLCDNDYGQHLERAAKLVYETFGNAPICVSERRVKEIVVDLVTVFQNMHAAACGFSDDLKFTKTYLINSLDVKFSNTAPNLDHDGGSVAIDRNTGYIWRF